MYYHHTCLKFLIAGFAFLDVKSGTIKAGLVLLGGPDPPNVQAYFRRQRLLSKILNILCFVKTASFELFCVSFEENISNLEIAFVNNTTNN